MLTTGSEFPGVVPEDLKTLNIRSLMKRLVVLLYRTGATWWTCGDWAGTTKFNAWNLKNKECALFWVIINIKWKLISKSSSVWLSFWLLDISSALVLMGLARGLVCHIYQGRLVPHFWLLLSPTPQLHDTRSGSLTGSPKILHCPGSMRKPWEPSVAGGRHSLDHLDMKSMLAGQDESATRLASWNMLKLTADCESIP